MSELSMAIQDAGIFVLFLVLPAGIIALGVAIAFAYRPTAKKRTVANAFIRTTVFAALSGWAAGMIGTSRAAFGDPGDHAQWHRIVVEGSGESINNLFLGFSLIALCCLFLAVGEIRAKA